MLRPSAASICFASLLGLSIGVAAGASSCGIDASAGDGFGGGGVGEDGSAATGTDASNDVLPDSPTPPASLSYKYLCGDGDCVPGKDLTCTPMTTGTSSATTGAGGGSGASGSGGGAGGEGGAGGADGAGGAGGAGGSGDEDYTCRVAVDDGKAASVCGVVGSGRVNDPCQGSEHCGEGLACVEVSGASNVGLCLPYCCDKLEDCPKDTFCNPRDLVEVPALLPARRVPVCEAAVECSLLTPGACADTKICSVVRADGTTSCVDRGDGKTCDPCPCDDGYVCNPNINQCRKLCHTASSINECGGGTCQGGSGNYPIGIGICVGGEAVCD